MSNIDSYDIKKCKTLQDFYLGIHQLKINKS